MNAVQVSMHNPVNLKEVELTVIYDHEISDEEFHDIRLCECNAQKVQLFVCNQVRDVTAKCPTIIAYSLPKL